MAALACSSRLSASSRLLSCLFERLEQVGIAAETGHLLGDPAGFAFGALQLLASGVERGRSDARFGLLGGLDGARLAERGLGGACLVLALHGADIDGEAAAFRRFEARGDRGQFLVEPADGGGGVRAERLFPKPVGGERAAALLQFGDAAADGIPLGAERRELVAERGRCLARGLGRFALVGDRFRGLILVSGGGALRLGRCRNRLPGGFGLAGRGLGGSVRLAPAREDQPGLRDPDLVGELAIALGGAGLAAERALA